MAKKKLGVYLRKVAWLIGVGVLVGGILGGGVRLVGSLQRSYKGEQARRIAAENSLARVKAELEKIKNEDPYKTNRLLEEEIEKIYKSFKAVGDILQSRADLVVQGEKVDEIDKGLAELLYALGERKLEDASSMAGKIREKVDKIAEQAKKKELAKLEKKKREKGENKGQTVVEGSLPEEGWQRFAVSTERGRYVVSVVVARGAKVIVDTASENDCTNNCPTLPLAEYVKRNGGFAGINGGYFCPGDYPQCQNKINSFDTLVFNGRVKKAFNVSNNVYSVVPIMVAYGSNLSFYDRTLEWGVDNKATGAVANYPLLIKGGQVVVQEERLSSYLRARKSTRGFIAKKNDKVIIGHVFGATVGEAAWVLKALGVDEALNLDGGGSAALWYGGGYKVGPGRNLPVGIVLVK